MSKFLEFIERYNIFIAAVAIAFAMALTHSSRIAANFSSPHWEDSIFIEHSNQHIHSISDCFAKPSPWPGLYRPLTTNCYYYAISNIFSTSTHEAIRACHVINVFLYWANAFLLFFICMRLMPLPWAFFPPLLFVSRHAHVEVILLSVEFQSLLSVFFSLLAVLFFFLFQKRTNAWLILLSCLSLLLALLSKETAIVIPAILIANGWLFDKSQSWKKYISPCLTGICWLILFGIYFPQNKSRSLRH